VNLPTDKLAAFVEESNRIEGIVRPPAPTEIAAHAAFLALRQVSVDDVEAFVQEVARAPLREGYGMDVVVGDHRPPSGGPLIRRGLESFVANLSIDVYSPFQAHVAYEQLHPFMDGNGRSGRVVWAWQMLHEGLDPFALPFLHRFYYQALEASRL
jgi:Fic/DOC family